MLTHRTPRQTPPSQRRQPGLFTNARHEFGVTRRPYSGIGQAVIREELRRRRVSAYLHLRKPLPRGRVLRVVLMVMTLFVALGTGAVGAAFAGYNAYKGQLPDAPTIVNMEPQIDTDVYDATGQLIHVFHNSGYRHVEVALADISPLFKEAIVDVEDRDFYTEGSFDLARLIEAGVADITHSSTIQGASTITEQLAKLSLYGGATPPQNIDYKIKEIVLGNEIELHFSKDQILEMYVDRIFFGNYSVGIGTAAELYFLKPASQLDLAQASMLAGLPQSPTADDPLTHGPKVLVNPLAKNRQGVVLEAMVANGDITQAQAAAAYAEKLTFHLWTESEPNLDPDFVGYLQGWLTANLPQYVSPGGYAIHTTLDPAKQSLAYNTVHTQVQKERVAENMRDGALVSLNPQNGEILAMVGTWNYADPFIGQYNMADTPINPGSTIKLFTYTAAIASTKFTMTTPILDGPYTFPIPENPGGYSPLDYDRRWHGVCELKQCLGNSFNMPAVKTEYATGIEYITNLEVAMGVSAIDEACTIGDQTYVNRPAPYEWAATLGSLTCGITLLDLADGAATLADRGVQHNPMPVTSIVAQASGQTLWKYNAAASGRQVVPANVAYIMNEITSNDANRLREFGANGYLTLNPHRVSAKTGTAPYFIDNLTVGWTPTLLTAVWVGSGTQSCLQPKDDAYMERQIQRGNIIEDGETSYEYPFSPSDLRHYGLQPINGDCGHLDGIVSGYSGAAPIWHDYMSAALRGVPATWYARPADIIASGSGDDADFYLPGTQPGASTNCTYYGPVPLPSQTCTYEGP
jgi:membrane peptidoglycan carboxypeptidase